MPFPSDGVLHLDPDGIGRLATSSVDFTFDGGFFRPISVDILTDDDLPGTSDVHWQSFLGDHLISEVITSSGPTPFTLEFDDHNAFRLRVSTLDPFTHFSIDNLRIRTTLADCE